MSTATPAGLFSNWRWFPLALLGSLAVVVAVNGTMIYYALTTFPGEAGQDGFDLSNAYDRVLDLSHRQSALGWQVATEAGPGRHALVRADDRTGLPLQDAVVQARAERPLGPKQEAVLTLRPDGQGRLLSEQTLSLGRWTVFVTVTQGSDTLSTTSQLTLR